MGCDIHVYLEHSSKKNNLKNRYWDTFGGRINPGRDYELFGKIAGVRLGPALIPPRGLPDDLSWKANGEAFLYVTDEAETDDSCSTSQAEQYAKYGAKIFKRGTLTFVEHPDIHSRTWLTPDELEAAMVAANTHSYEFDHYIDPDTSEVSKRRNTVQHSCDAEYHALLAAARELEKRGREVRFVIWFDN